MVLRVAGTETERWVPCAGMAELLNHLPGDLTADLPKDRLTGRPEPHPAEAAGRAGADHLACRLAFRGMLARCAGERPVLLLLDGAQWLDAESAQAVRR
ncbi:MAG TPA: hypothetical protein VFV01_32020 [Spirillospora sp.]|nr:hypothetical protein [Spirillospora sp.]